MGLSISRETFLFFASSPLAPLWTVYDVANDPSHRCHRDLVQSILSIPHEVAEAELLNPHSRFFIEGRAKLGDDALISESRKWIAIRLLNEMIDNARLNELRIGIAPYERKELGGVQVDEEGLVKTAEFAFDGHSFHRKQRAFMVLPFTPCTNASYWFLQYASAQPWFSRLKVRLDPFLSGPSHEFPTMGYAMRVYGKPMSWARIDGLRDVEHGEWISDDPDRDGGLTQFAWAPRGDEVHFVCEEVPDRQLVSRRASRYLHAIYSRARKTLVHVDGALRIYDAASIEERHNRHVRDAGKVGQRVKVFRVDVDMDRDSLADIGATFFVWNSDVGEYFSGTNSA